ncbi:MAG: CAP domain-containing protein [Thermoleophilaceae bacterium]|jgi:uncharacterized protein YkwD
MRRLRACAVVCLLVCAAVPSAAVAATSEDSMVAELNAARAAHDRPALKVSPALGASAEGYAGWMMRSNAFGHRSPLPVPRGFALRAEILALRSGTGPMVVPTVRLWLDSPGHRAAMLDPRYEWVGVGRAKGRFGGRTTTIWVAHFGRR